VFVGFVSITYGQGIAQEQTEIISPNESFIQIEFRASEPIPTPEEQGFTKHIENGIVFYLKESNGFITEFIPKQ
jgi:hypothetical protein